MKNISNINFFLRKAVFIDKIARFAILLEGGYQLSILTGSHFYSAELGTIEVALMRNGKFAFGVESDDSIIHYMPYSLWLDFVGDIQQVEPASYEKIFKEYKDLEE